MGIINNNTKTCFHGAKMISPFQFKHSITSRYRMPSFLLHRPSLHDSPEIVSVSHIPCSAPKYHVRTETK